MTEFQIKFLDPLIEEVAQIEDFNRARAVSLAAERRARQLNPEYKQMREARHARGLWRKRWARVVIGAVVGGWVMVALLVGYLGWLTVKVNHIGLVMQMAK